MTRWNVPAKGFTDSEILLIKDTMRGQKILTQSVWKKLQPELGNINSIVFARRATVSKLDVKIGYAWDEHVWGIHSTKALVQIECVHCDCYYVALAGQLHNRKHKVPACATCYAEHHLYDAEWRQNNSSSQKIAQNRPETLKKHRQNSIKLWQGAHGDIMRAAQQECVSQEKYKNNMARIMRIKWASDPEYRDRVNGKGTFKHVGVCDNVKYDSKLELAFLLWCVEHDFRVCRCMFCVSYVDPVVNKEHDYYPDFVVNDTTIVEVKGQRWIDVSPETYRAKIDALAVYCESNGYAYRVVLDKDMKKYSHAASEYHEAQKKNNVPV